MTQNGSWMTNTSISTCGRGVTYKVTSETARKFWCTFFVTTSVPVVNSKSIHSLATMSPVRFAHLNGLQNQHRLHPGPRIYRGGGGGDGCGTYPTQLLTASRVLSPEILEDTFQFDVTTLQLLAYNLLDPFVYISIISKYTVLRDSHEDPNNSTSGWPSFTGSPARAGFLAWDAHGYPAAAVQNPEACPLLAYGDLGILG